MNKLSLKIYFVAIAIIFLIAFLARALSLVLLAMLQPSMQVIVEVGVVTTGVITLLGLSFAIRFIIIRRLKTLTNAMSRVASGDFDAADLPVLGNDELSELFASFNLMTAELKSNEYLNRDFVKNVSHELKTPISSIIGYAELLEANIDNPELAEYAAVIRQEAVRLSTLSQNLLQISFLDSSTIVRQDDEYLLDEQLRQVLVVMQNQWEAKQLEFDLRLEEIYYRGNRELTYIVWQNLISNAIKFSPNDSQIKIDLTSTDKEIAFEIADSGIGMSPAEQVQVFDQFFIADKQRNKSGSGLGLSIVKKIIDKLGGTIAVNSEPTQGTSFTVHLPYSQPVPKPSPEPIAPPQN